MSAAFPIDWDGDGDVDLVVGSVKGGVYLNKNEGTRTEMKFGERVALLAGGAPMRVIQKSDPVAVDWDGDGALDLLVGDEATGVTFFKGDHDRKFATGVSLFTGEPIPARLAFEKHVAWWQQQSKLPGYRARIAVSDWNEDGKLDLLLGNCEQSAGATTGEVFLFLRK
jgi:VCBS repeat protein